MSNYIKKAAAHARLLKLASAARLIRRQRALQKYAQAVQMQKAALSTGAQAGIGAGLGGLIGGGIGYGLGKKDKKLLSALIGAGAGAGIGGLGGYALGKYLNKPKGFVPDPYTQALVNIEQGKPGAGSVYAVDNNTIDGKYPPIQITGKNLTWQEILGKIAEKTHRSQYDLENELSGLTGGIDLYGSMTDAQLDELNRNAQIMFTSAFPGQQGIDAPSQGVAL